MDLHRRIQKLEGIAQSERLQLRSVRLAIVKELLSEDPSPDMLKRLEDGVEGGSRSLRQRVQDVIDIQATDGNWDHDPYMHGFLNGMLMIQSVITDQEPEYRDAPDKWKLLRMEVDDAAGCDENDLPMEITIEKGAFRASPFASLSFPNLPGLDGREQLSVSAWLAPAKVRANSGLKNMFALPALTLFSLIPICRIISSP